MSNRKVLLVTALTLTAIVAGVVVGQFFPAWAGKYAEAADELPVPAWKDLQVVYYGPKDYASSESLINPDTFASEINAHVVSNADDVVKDGIENGIDILVVERSVLGKLNAAWARTQYRQGTVFVGLNITPSELENLLGSPAFSGEPSIEPLQEPFLTYAYVKLSGDARQIDLLRQSDIVFPPSSSDRARIGLENVFVQTGASYTPVNETLTVQFLLDDIRLNLNAQDLVRPAH